MTSAFLNGLKSAAERAEVAETKFRREIAERTKALERERAFAFRRLNFMRAVADAIASAENEDTAVAVASSVLRAKLGWASDSEARDEVVARFKPVARAMFASLAPPEAEADNADPGQALADFEAWYANSHPAAFWTLFEHYMPETPLVDF
jgi:hypothetical protein